MGEDGAGSLEGGRSPGRRWRFPDRSDFDSEVGVSPQLPSQGNEKLGIGFGRFGLFGWLGRNKRRERRRDAL